MAEITVNININNLFITKHNLNISEAYLLAYYVQAASWAKPSKIDDRIYYFVSRNMVAQHIPQLTDKPDTIYRLTLSLVRKGMIAHVKIGHADYVSMNPIIQEWYMKSVREIFPTLENASKKGEISPEQREKSPEKKGNISLKRGKNIRQSGSNISGSDSGCESECGELSHNPPPTAFADQKENLSSTNATPTAQTKPRGGRGGVKNTLSQDVPTLAEVEAAFLQKSEHPEFDKQEAIKFYAHHIDKGFAHWDLKLQKWKLGAYYQKDLAAWQRGKTGYRDETGRFVVSRTTNEQYEKEVMEEAARMGLKIF